MRPAVVESSPSESSSGVEELGSGLRFGLYVSADKPGQLVPRLSRWRLKFAAIAPAAPLSPSSSTVPDVADAVPLSRWSR